MAYRATKSGIAAEAKGKIDAKYKTEVAGQCLEWIRKKTGDSFSTSGDQDNFHEVLKDGYILARLMQSLNEPVPAKREKLAFRQMDLIEKCINAMKRYGVTDSESFQTVDLFEAQNLNQVVTALESLGRKAQAKGGSGFGPKEADANVRNFSEEQLKAGQNIIGLQMGTNKGASQKGMNIGNTRHIVD